MLNHYIWYISPLNANKFLFCCALLACLNSCVHPRGKDDQEKEIVNLFHPANDTILGIVKKTLDPWKGNSIIKTSAGIESMKLVFRFDPENAFEGISKVLGKENITDVPLFLEFKFNDETIIKELSEIKAARISGLMYVGLVDSSGVFMEKISTRSVMPIHIDIPVFILRRFPANKKINVKVHVWQDHFLFDREQQGNDGKPLYFTDTIIKKLIDNTYNFSFSMPEIYMTEIICDSIVLQNDKEWTPGGSDHTLFKSSYPDIFYSIYDHTVFEQSSSHVEKSTDRFVKGDTLLFYSYKKHEPFYLEVCDFDFLSKNDLLADTMLDVDLIKNNKTEILKFGHVDRFYFRKKAHGKIN